MNYQLKARQVSIVIDETFGIFETQTRFDICDADAKVIDDAQGYGYKTAQSAHKAAAYKFKGGKQTADSAKAFWRQHSEFAKTLSDMLLNNFKDLLRTRRSSLSLLNVAFLDSIQNAFVH